MVFIIEKKGYQNIILSCVVSDWLISVSQSLLKSWHIYYNSIQFYIIDIISSLSSLYRDTCLPEPTSTPNSTHTQLHTASHVSQHLISTPTVNLTSTTPSLHSTTGGAHVPSPRTMPSVTCSSDKHKKPSSLSHHWKDLMGGVDSVNSSMEATQQVSNFLLQRFIFTYHLWLFTEINWYWFMKSKYNKYLYLGLRREAEIWWTPGQQWG